MKPRQQRMALIAGVLVGVVLAVGFGFRAFQENLSYFFSPSDVAAGKAPAGRSFRLGGMVVKDSVQRESGSLTIAFVVTDFANTVPVRYTGVLPDLFKEGKGVVVRGQVGADGNFVAQEVLAKHDENYMPPEVKDALAKSRQAENK
ncbi:MAG: cytochrome c maturation protein CcmE [Gammaproteobacteria bacterium]